ncbi:MAG: hypothetical protein ACR2MG_08445 [Pyrinomonadaceae bacterium]
MKKALFLFVFGLFVCAASVSAQPRPIGKKTEQKTEQNSTPKTPAPASFAAKYEGGMFGFDKKEKGTLKFDDTNRRIIFIGQNQKEMFSIPYKSMLVIYPQSKSVRSTTGTVVSVIPLPGAVLAGLIREKRRYLVVHFDDPDIDAKGVVNFKLDNKELLNAVIDALGEKAELTRRGAAYYRPKKDSK